MQVLDMDLSNSKYEKLRKLMNKGGKALSSKFILNKLIEISLCKGFKIKWFENKKDKEGNECKEELENYGWKMSYTWGVESCSNHVLINHKIDYKTGNVIVVIMNSCDGAVHIVTRYCDRTMLTQ